MRCVTSLLAEVIGLVAEKGGTLVCIKKKKKDLRLAIQYGTAVKSLDSEVTLASSLRAMFLTMLRRKTLRLNCLGSDLELSSMTLASY